MKKYIYTTFIILFIAIHSAFSQCDIVDLYMPFYEMSHPPVFKNGGIEALRKWMQENATFQMDSIKKIYIKVRFDTLGNINLKNVSPKLLSVNEEAKRLISIIPEFEPGKHNGKKMNTDIILIFVPIGNKEEAFKCYQNSSKYGNAFFLYPRKE